MVSILVPKPLRAPASDRAVLVLFPYPWVGLICDAEVQQVGARQVGELLEWLDGAELILAVLVVVDGIAVRAGGCEQLELIIDLFGFERLYGVPSLDQRW
ncbi:hypothetical protein ABQG55_05915 [Aeromonas dhakensis]|uniref:hypothetical protein n=1 Tax=Aeromonas dhakensis TaxID=196024 RepID=UPI0032EFD812